jgi:hypothetical protein
MGIKRREISFGLRGSASDKHQVILTGNYAIACSIGVILGGLLLALPRLLRLPLSLTDEIVSIFDVVGIVAILASFFLTIIFQVAVDLGRSLGKQEPREK